MACQQTSRSFRHPLLQIDKRQHDSLMITPLRHCTLLYYLPTRSLHFWAKHLCSREKDLIFSSLVDSSGSAAVEHGKDSAAMTRHFGEIDGYPSGSLFQDRHDLAAARVHAPLQAGISGDKEFGAESIVLSGGYEDDEDFGDVILYTGQGGNQDRKQVSPQALVRGNLALARSRVLGRPVRVVRGSRHDFRHIPDQEVITGYRYDGLFQVDSYWIGIGLSRLPIWRFRLVKSIVDQTIQTKSGVISEDSPAYYPLEEGEESPTFRNSVIIQRIVRNTEVANSIKSLYAAHCQVCRMTISTIAGNYSEAAHVRPLGDPHNGPDHPSNILCLCPNHHAMFDLGGFVIREDFDLMSPSTGELLGTLHVHPEHHLNLELIRYHRSMFTDDVVVPFDPEARTYRTTNPWDSRSNKVKLRRS